MDEKLKVYDDKMTKTIKQSGKVSIAANPRRTCQSTCIG